MGSTATAFNAFAAASALRLLPKITPRRYLLIVETGDEVLDYRRAVERYAGAEQVVVRGGDHSLQSFPSHLARVLSFAGY